MLGREISANSALPSGGQFCAAQIYLVNIRREHPALCCWGCFHSSNSPRIIGKETAGKLRAKRLPLATGLLTKVIHVGKETPFLQGGQVQGDPESQVQVLLNGGRGHNGL